MNYDTRTRVIDIGTFTRSMTQTWSPAIHWRTWSTAQHITRFTISISPLTMARSVVFRTPSLPIFDTYFAVLHMGWSLWWFVSTSGFIAWPATRRTKPKKIVGQNPVNIYGTLIFCINYSFIGFLRGWDGCSAPLRCLDIVSCTLLSLTCAPPCGYTADLACFNYH